MKLKHDIEPTRSSGTGAAHIWGPFGRRGPLLDEQDGGGGSSGGTGGEKPAGSGGEKSDPVAEKKHSDADVERIVKERLDRDRRERRTEQTPSTKPGKTSSSKADKTTDDAGWVFEFTDALDAVSEEIGWKPSRGLKSRMREAFKAERPDDPDAWVKSWADDSGHKQSDPNPQNPTSQQQSKDGSEQKPVVKQAEGASLSDKGGAGGAPLDFEAKLTERPLELSKLDIQRLTEKHGEEKACVMIRDAVNRKLKTIKLVADPRRKA